MNKTVKKVLKGIAFLFAVLISLVVLFFAVLTITEFRPKDQENVTIENAVQQKVEKGDSLTIVTWNIGYGGLDETEDFFMDGGTSKKSASKEMVENNLSDIAEQIETMNPDILMLQEVDRNSTRTHYYNEKAFLDEKLSHYENSFSNNYKSLWVPYPIPMLGKVDSGIATYSKYGESEAVRVSLPCPFSYPVRLCNLKRCLMVNRIPVEGTQKELVIVNLHLEAYDSGEGKEKQTKMLFEFLEEEEEKGNYVIAGGDFNQTFAGVDTTKFPTISEEYWQPGMIEVDELSDRFTFFMDENTASCRSLDKVLKGADKENFQYYVIDGFIVSNNVRIEEVKAVDLSFKSSDHNPLRMKVTLE